MKREVAAYDKQVIPRSECQVRKLDVYKRQGGDPSGASAEKGRIILETSARELVPGLLDIRDWNE